MLVVESRLVFPNLTQSGGVDPIMLAFDDPQPPISICRENVNFEHAFTAAPRAGE
jgi:hypothetical protein